MLENKSLKRGVVYGGKGGRECHDSERRIKGKRGEAIKRMKVQGGRSIAANLFSSKKKKKKTLFLV